MRQTDLSRIASLCQSFLATYEHSSRRERTEELVRLLHGATGPGELDRACLKLRAAAAGPGVRSEAFASALGEVFALLPKEDAGLGIHVSDGLVMEVKVGG